MENRRGTRAEMQRRRDHKRVVKVGAEMDRGEGMRETVSVCVCVCGSVLVGCGGGVVVSGGV